MFALRVLSVVLAAASLAPCDGSSASDGGAEAAVTPPGDAAGAPVIDDVTLPPTATIDISTGRAHVIGSISFHSDDSAVVGVNILAHGTSGSIYRGPLGAASPQSLIFDLSTPGTYSLDFNVFDSKNRYSAIVTQTITVRE
ncbi:MAG: hypothetical protein JWM74_4681 [Myxococcaceae bacterium]|nr:hypothetical protein [Myxococcaceae bacterium]